MQAIFQSNFLQSLGFAIANSLWQIAIIWLLYLLVSHVFRVSPAVKYRMAVAAQLVGFIWFVFTLQFYYSQYNEALRNSAGLLPDSHRIQAVMAGEHGFTSQLIRAMVWIENTLPYISTAYLLLIIFLAIRWISGYRQTQLIRTQGLQKIPVEWRLFVKNTAAQLGIKKDIRLFLSENITTPLTIGFLKPVILVPLASINHLSTAQLEAVLLHELAHIKRFDYLINIILSVTEIALFFNPFTQLLSRSIRKERENCCDDWVLQFRYSATDYAEALLRIACLQQPSPALAMAASGKKNELLVRVKRMIGQKDNRFNYRRQLLALVMVTTMLGCMAWLDPVVSDSDKKQVTTNNTTTQDPALPDKTIAIEPMAVKVENPLFNPVFFLSEPLKKQMAKNIEAAQDELNALIAPGGRHEGLIESIPPMVAGALDKASLALSQLELTTENRNKEFAGMELAMKKMNREFADSLSFIPGFRAIAGANEFTTSLKTAKENIEKARKEFLNYKNGKKNTLIDTEKIKSEVGKAMDQLSTFQVDKWMEDAFKAYEMVAPEIRKSIREEGKREAQPKENMEMRNPPMPKIPGFYLDEKAMPAIRISHEEIVVGDVSFNKEFLKDIQALAELVKSAHFEELSPEQQEQFKLRIEKFIKLHIGNNRMMRMAKDDKAKEEDHFKLQMQ